MEENDAAQAVRRQQEIYRIESEFEAVAARIVKQIVTLDDNGPRELPKFLQCFRVDNIFFRVLPDSRSGRNYIASLRGVLQSRTRLLTVPLSCMFFYRGMPVLAQALVPMPPTPTRLYGAGSTNDPEVEAEIALMANALNIPLPEEILCEVYAGMDARFYCLSTNVTTIPISLSCPFVCPVKRQEMLIFCPCVLGTPDDVLAVLRAAPVLDALAQLREISALADAQSLRGKCAVEMEALEICVVVEMVARAIKQEFYLSVQSNRVAYDEVELKSLIARHIGSAFDKERYFTTFIPVLIRKYGISNDEMNFLQRVDVIRRAHQADIVARLSVLIGARLPASESRTASNASAATVTSTTATTSQSRSLSVPGIVWLPMVSSRVAPRLADPNMTVALAAQFRASRTSELHMCAYGVPLQSKVAEWEGNYEEALRLARLAAQGQQLHYGANSFAHLYALRTLCELLFAGGTHRLIEEGVDVLEVLLHGFTARAAPLTRLRRHVEVGCWLLGCSDVTDLTAEALRHFKAAAKLAPPELRGPHGAWLYTQPHLGMLRCRQSGRETLQTAVDLTALAADATKLAGSVIPADYYVEYLWEIGMELKRDNRYATAAEALVTALDMSRKVSTTDLDVCALRDDLIGVYRAWDPKKYASYCDALLSRSTAQTNGNST